MRAPTRLAPDIPARLLTGLRTGLARTLILPFAFVGELIAAALIAADLACRLVRRRPAHA